MGMYISPAILQSLLTRLIRAITDTAWVHIDDILIFGNSPQQVHGILVNLLQELHKAGFQLNTRKSTLKPSQRLHYCGLVLDTRQNNF